MNENYEYSPAVFRALAEILEQLQADMKQLPKSIKCYPCLNDFPHVEFEYTDAFRDWAIPKRTRIVPIDGDSRYVRLTVDIGNIRIFAVIPAANADEWRTT